MHGVPFQELQVSKRNRQFEQNFQLSQHLFPVPFFLLRSGCPWRIVLLRLPWRLWASLLECGHPWDAWPHPNNIHIQHPTPKTKHPSLWSQTTSVSQRVLGHLFKQISSPLFRRLRWSLEPQWMIQFQKWLSQFSLLEPSPCCLLGPSYPTGKLHFLGWRLFDTTKLLHCVTWVGSPLISVNSKFWWAKTRSLTAAPSFLLVVSFSRSLCPNLMVLLLLFASIVYITTC